MPSESYVNIRNSSQNKNFCSNIRIVGEKNNLKMPWQIGGNIRINFLFLKNQWSFIKITEKTKDSFIKYDNLKMP